MAERVTVIGAGLAGCEAALALAHRGVPVRLCEMKPQRRSPAHVSERFAELVCSNSLRSDQLHNAVGLLHEEMRRLGSIVLEAADATRVPAGGALAVDRERFAAWIDDAVHAHPAIEIAHGEVTDFPEGTCIVATGPLTAGPLAERIRELCGDALYFYDSIAPTVYADSIDLGVAYRASRYESEAEGDYLNLPLDEPAYRTFVDELVRGEKVPLHSFERALYFEGCLPIEVMAERGPLTLAFGPMKPVGLPDPRTGREPFAVVQLRQENKAATLYNLVGFQTKLRQSEQQRIFRTLPGMSGAVFARYGSAHRNTFIRAPALLTEQLEHRERPGLYFAGQIAGVEGYVESAALGLLAGIFAARRAHGLEPAPLPPPATALGALCRHLRESDPAHFQPMNVNFGLFPPLDGRAPRGRRERHARLAERALRELGPWLAEVRA
jgi:methylenetetrahydrofolate--tRNA-(uracil-5-)-methyltransferase